MITTSATSQNCQKKNHCESVVIILVAMLNSKRPDKKSQPTISPINHKISQPHWFPILPFILCTCKSCLPVACLIPHSLRSRNSPISSSLPFLQCQTSLPVSTQSPTTMIASDWLRDCAGPSSQMADNRIRRQWYYCASHVPISGHPRSPPHLLLLLTSSHSSPFPLTTRVVCPNLLYHPSLRGRLTCTPRILFCLGFALWGRLLVHRISYKGRLCLQIDPWTKGEARGPR